MKELLEKLNDDPRMVEAIEQLLMGEFDLNKLNLNEKKIVEDSALAMLLGREMLKGGFKKLKSFKRVEMQKGKINNAI